MPNHFDPAYLALEHTQDLVNEVRELRLEIMALRTEVEALREGRSSSEGEARKASSTRLSEWSRRNLGPRRVED